MISCHFTNCKPFILIVCIFRSIELKKQYLDNVIRIF